MEWLILMLRALFSFLQRNGTGPQRIAVRQDGTTLSLPPEPAEFSRRFRFRGWLNLFLPFSSQVREDRFLDCSGKASEDGIPSRWGRWQWPPSGGAD
jgi:hypothetical protein